MVVEYYHAYFSEPYAADRIIMVAFNYGRHGPPTAMTRLEQILLFVCNCVRAAALLHSRHLSRSARFVSWITDADPQLEVSFGVTDEIFVIIVHVERSSVRFLVLFITVTLQRRVSVSGAGAHEYVYASRLSTRFTDDPFLLSTRAMLSASKMPAK